MLLEDVEHRNVYIFGIVFVICFVIAAAVINYFTYSPEGEFAGWESILALVFWSVQYLPIFVFHKFAKWEIKDFGFVTNYKVFLILVLAAIIVLPHISNLPKSTFKNALIEAYARTGEEVLSRGFVYELAIKLFKNKKRPWIWAVVISSVMFTACHSQILLPTYHTSLTSVFELSLILALFRYWTGSTLFGIIFHIFVNEVGIYGILFGILIYYVVVLLAYKKGENVFAERT